MGIGRATFLAIGSSAAIAVLVGCGGGDTTTTVIQQVDTSAVTTTTPSTTSTTPAAGDEAAIQDLYTRYFDALRADEGEAACALLTSDYQDQVVTEAGGGDCPAAVSVFAGLYADYHPRLEKITVSGETATATDPGDSSQGFSAQTVRFELVDGQWLIADAG